MSYSVKGDFPLRNPSKGFDHGHHSLKAVLLLKRENPIDFSPKIALHDGLGLAVEGIASDQNIGF